MDVVEGRGPAPSLVVPLIMRLPDDSMTAALARGGPEHLGWGTTRYMLSAIFDAINNNTRATGQWKAKPPKMPSFPTPGAKQKEAKPQSVAGLFAAIQQKG